MSTEGYVEACQLGTQRVELEYALVNSAPVLIRNTQEAELKNALSLATESFDRHTSVPVPAQIKEDRFGLRMWNTISGETCARLI